MRKRNRQPTLRSVKMFRLRAGCRKPNIGGFSVLPIRLRHIRPRLRDGFRWKSEPSLCILLSGFPSRYPLAARTSRAAGSPALAKGQRLPSAPAPLPWRSVGRSRPNPSKQTPVRERGGPASGLRPMRRPFRCRLEAVIIVHLASVRGVSQWPSQSRGRCPLNRERSMPTTYPPRRVS
jgi:hypothetical protein